jgi:peptide/nickel transport system permease protein
MTRYIVRRLIGTIPTLFVVSLLIFSILQATPGGPASKFDQNPKVTPAQIAAFKHRWGLDQPIHIQYCRWVGVCNPDGQGILGTFISNQGWPNFLPGFLGGGDNGVLHGDFGQSSTSGSSVASLIGARILPTAILAGVSLVIWILLALLTGVISAVRRYSKIDNAITIFNYIGFSFPTFWLGLMLIVVFSLDLRLLPASGMWNARTVPIFGSPEYWTFFGKNPGGALSDLAFHLVLPVITLVFVNVAGDSRFIRAAMIDSLNQDYVRTARAKGVAERKVVFTHALRNALLPVVTNVAIELPFLFSGAIATETIFSWPGMGLAYIQAVRGFDYPVLMGILVITAVFVVLANLLADILYAVVDPRISYG